MMKIGFGIAAMVLGAALTGCGGLGTGTNGNPQVMKQESPTPNDSVAPSAPVTTPPTYNNSGAPAGSPSATPTQNPPGSQLNNTGTSQQNSNVGR